MNKFLMAASAAALLAGSALANGSASTQVISNVTQFCKIDAQSAVIDLTGTAVDTAVPGVFTYECNFAGQPTLLFTSTLGGMVNPADVAGPRTYGIYLNDVAPPGPPSTWLQSNAGATSYSNITTSVTANVPVTPFFSVGKTQDTLVAGLYSDTLTITISP